MEETTEMPPLSPTLAAETEQRPSTPPNAESLHQLAAASSLASDIAEVNASHLQSEGDTQQQAQDHTTEQQSTQHIPEETQQQDQQQPGEQHAPVAQPEQEEHQQQEHQQQQEQEQDQHDQQDHHDHQDQPQQQHEHQHEQAAPAPQAQPQTQQQQHQAIQAQTQMLAQNQAAQQMQQFQQQQPQGHAVAHSGVPMQQQTAPAPMPTPSVPSGGGGQAPHVTTCQNCETSTTPLWRRDEFGAVLCNACGLFLKLHGRARPISLKTDVIKSRNRVKTIRPDLAARKKAQQQQQQAQAQGGFAGHDANGFDLSAQSGQRIGAQKNANGHNDARGDAGLYNSSMSMFQGTNDSGFQSASLSGLNIPGGPSDRPTSPLNGDRKSDTPQTNEQLLAQNAALKTRVSELEFIVELFRGRISQLEQDEANARQGQENSAQAEAQARAQLDESHMREVSLKRRLDELQGGKEFGDDLSMDDPERAAKRQRLDDPLEDPHQPVTDPALEASTLGEPAHEGESGTTEPVHDADAAPTDPNHDGMTTGMSGNEPAPSDNGPSDRIAEEAVAAEVAEAAKKLVTA